MKKTLIVIGVVLVVLLVALGFLWFTSETPREDAVGKTTAPFNFVNNLFNRKPEPTTTPETGTTAGEAPASFRSAQDILSQQRGFLVTDERVAHAIFITVTTGTTTEERLRYVERETGHINDYVLRSGETVRVSNTTIPRIQETLWGNRGSFLALRYLDDDGETIETFLGSISETDVGLVGSFLPKNIKTIALNPEKAQAFYLLDTGTGSVGRLYDAETGTTRALFSSPLSEWTASWNAAASVFLHTKPSAQSSGMAIILSLTSGNMTRSLAGTTALSGLQNKNGLVLIGFRENATPRLGLFDPATQTTKTLSGNTLPEKCAWIDTDRVACALPENTDGAIPDAWYEGTASFSDSMWVISTKDNLTNFMFDAEDLGEEFDAIRLSVNADGTIVAFVNKKDSRLWVARLLEPTTGE